MVKPYTYPFDIESNFHGVKVIVTREPLCNNCRSDDTVDSEIDRLIGVLESLRPKMKAEVALLHKAPLDLQTTAKVATDNG